MGWRDDPVITGWQADKVVSQPFVGPPVPQMSRTESALRGFAQGASFGWADEMAAGSRLAEERDAPLSQQTIMTPADASALFRDTLSRSREKLAEARASNPWTTGLSEVAGGIVSGRAVPAGTTKLGRIGWGALTGGVYGLGASDKSSIATAALDTGASAATGALTSAVAGAIADKFANRGKAPTIDEIKRAKDAAYSAADASDQVVPLSRIGQLIPKAEEMLRSEGYRPKLHPSAAESLAALYEEATQPEIYGQTLKGAEGLRRQLVQAEMAATNPADARMAGKVLDEFDSFMDELTPYKEARSLYHTLRKAQDIEALFEKAKNAAGGYTQSGYENALRIQFRQLADNPRRFNKFTPEERDAILKVVRGGPIQSVVRFIGKFAPRGPVSAMATSLLGGSIGGPGGAAALAAK